jgi:hypothetical protein
MPKKAEGFKIANRSKTTRITVLVKGGTTGMKMEWNEPTENVDSTVGKFALMIQATAKEHGLMKD